MRLHLTRFTAIAALAVPTAALVPVTSWAAVTTLGFSSPSALNTDAATDGTTSDSPPDLATDGLGNWIAAWTKGLSSLMVARSTNGGATWTSPVAIGSGFEPHVSTDGAGNWVVAWYGSAPGGGSDWDIVVARSTNAGASWTSPAAVNTNATTDSGNDYGPRVATDGLGNWVAVWQSRDSLGGTIGTDDDILVARSTNNGATWTTVAALNTNAATDSGSDYRPTIATDGMGAWVTTWYSADDLGGTIGTDVDILVSRSTNNGLTWTAPTALNTNAATDSGDDLHSDIATDGAGTWVTVWQSFDSLGATIGTDDDILVARSTNNGATWTTPAPLNTNAATDSGGDVHARITTDGAGKWLVVWESFDTLGGTVGSDRDILISLSQNGGASWSTVAALNSNAPTDSGDDYEPSVATDTAGSWVVVWYSGDTLGGLIGTDWDILTSRSSSVPVELSVFSAQ